MPRNFNWLFAGANGGRRGVRFWLQMTGGMLLLLNGIALFLYLDPPGGSRSELTRENLRIRNEVNIARKEALKMKAVAAKVQLGNTESSEFESKYFLPKRTAYEVIIAEIQRMAKASGLQERDAVFTEEPVEGTSDLTILNSAANYEGPYPNLMHFLYQVDQSPALLMLESLTAAPQPRGGQIAANIRFQAIVREEPAAPAGGQP